MNEPARIDHIPLTNPAIKKKINKQPETRRKHSTKKKAVSKKTTHATQKRKAVRKKQKQAVFYHVLKMLFPFFLILTISGLAFFLFPSVVTDYLAPAFLVLASHYYVKKQVSFPLFITLSSVEASIYFHNGAYAALSVLAIWLSRLIKKEIKDAQLVSAPKEKRPWKKRIKQQALILSLILAMVFIPYWFIPNENGEELFTVGGMRIGDTLSILNYQYYANGHYSFLMATGKAKGTWMTTGNHDVVQVVLSNQVTTDTLKRLSNIFGTNGIVDSHYELIIPSSNPKQSIPYSPVFSLNQLSS
jgi:hypothetical protein